MSAIIDLMEIQQESLRKQREWERLSPDQRKIINLQEQVLDLQNSLAGVQPLIDFLEKNIRYVPMYQQFTINRMSVILSDVHGPNGKLIKYLFDPNRINGIGIKDDSNN